MNGETENGLEHIDILINLNQITETENVVLQSVTVIVFSITARAPNLSKSLLSLFITGCGEKQEKQTTCFKKSTCPAPRITCQDLSYRTSELSVPCI